MEEAQCDRLSQDLLEAQTEGARTRVLVHWLPILVRCQIKTAARAKLHVEQLRRLEAKVDALHAAPRFKDDKLGWLRANWKWLIIFLLLLK